MVKFIKIGCFLVALSICLFILIKSNIFFAANFADEVLRPLIGTPATLTLEASFFGSEDLINHIKYFFIKPSVQNFQPNKTRVAADGTDTFTLVSIPSLTNFPKLPGEGIWTWVNSGSHSIYMAKTFVRPDPQRDYAIVTLVKMNMDKLSLGLAAGTWEPGENIKRGTGIIPKSVQLTNNLIAAFNGGFKRTDGYYGMIVGNDIFLPLKPNAATLVISQNAKPQIIRFTGNNLGKHIIAIRQNGPMLLENGHDVSSSPAWNMQTWGLTTTNSMYTWRSGIGITKNGNLLYAVGPSLIPQTLAKALQMAGAINAMQLDINPVWVRFVLFKALGNGQYTYTSLQNDMINGGHDYLYGYQKDFFYVTKK